jgi:hypothetical protein
MTTLKAPLSMTCLLLCVAAPGCGTDIFGGGGESSAAERAGSGEVRGDVNDFLVNCVPPEEEPVAETATNLAASTTKTGASYYTCGETRYEGRERYEQLTVFGGQNGELWPGNVIDFELFMKTGRVQGVNVPRGPVELVVGDAGLAAKTLPGEDQKSPFIALVDEPSSARMLAAMQRLLSTPGLTANGALEMAQSDYNSEQQLSKDLKISARFSGYGVNASLSAIFSSKKTSKRHTHLFQLTKRYVPVIASTPQQPSDWFAASVGVKDLEGSFDCQRPFAVIKRVIYGQTAVIRVESNEDLETTRRDLSAAISFKGSGASAGGTKNSVLNTSKSTMTSYIVGVSGDVAIQPGDSPENQMAKIGTLFEAPFGKGRFGSIIGMELQDAKGRTIVLGDPYDFTFPTCEPVTTNLWLLPTKVYSNNTDYLFGLRGTYLDGAGQALDYMKSVAVAPKFQDGTQEGAPPGLFWSQPYTPSAVNVGGFLRDFGLQPGDAISVPVRVADDAVIELDAYFSRVTGSTAVVTGAGENKLAKLSCNPDPNANPPACRYDIGQPNAVVGADVLAARELKVDNTQNPYGQRTAWVKLFKSKANLQ